MPEVIVIDEIGTELEAAAARTIAERGVQLVGTAHGNTLENLMMNPTLCDLAGGIQTVTLGDDEARRRGTQKSVLERKAPPTFDVIVEIRDWDRVAVRRNVADSVDGLLRDRSLPVELRFRDASGDIVVEKEEQKPLPREQRGKRSEKPLATGKAKPPAEGFRALRVYPYGINQSRLRQAGKDLNLPVLIVDDILEADVLFTLRSYYRKRPHIVTEAERRGVPIYIMRSNTVTQMANYLIDIFGIQVTIDPTAEAVEETRGAISQILSGTRASVELSPQSSYVRRLQHDLVREASLISRSKGKEPRRRVRIYQNQ